MSVNKVYLLGFLGQNPELNHTNNGAAVCNMSVATSENWTDRSGQKQERTEWHRIVTFNKTAENCYEYLSKGRQVFIEGKLQTRSWDDKEGNKRYTTEILASNVQFIGSNNVGDTESQETSEGTKEDTSQQVDLGLGEMPKW